MLRSRPRSRALEAGHCFDESRLYDGVPEMIDSLRRAGLRLAVFSNKDDGDVKKVISHYFDNIPFDIMRGRVDGYPLKPDPAGACQIARDMGLEPDEFWYLGDTPTDFQTCRNAGMHFIAVLWGFRTREELLSSGAGLFASTPLEAARIILNDPAFER